MARINPIELQKSLKGASYPASKADVVKAAEENGASDDIMEALKKLDDSTYETPADVSKALGDEM